MRCHSGFFLVKEKRIFGGKEKKYERKICINERERVMKKCAREGEGREGEGEGRERGGRGEGEGRERGGRGEGEGKEKERKKKGDMMWRKMARAKKRINERERG